MNYVKTQNSQDYILVFSVIMFTGFMSFSAHSLCLVFLLPFIYIILRKRKINIPTRMWNVLLSYIVLLIAQMVVHHGTLNLVASMSLKTLVIMLISVIISPKFVATYTKVMFHICIISLSCWLLCGIPLLRDMFRMIASVLPELRSNEFLEFSTNPADSTYFFVIPYEDTFPFRNSGPFWEPGVFVVFLVLALTISLFNSHRFFSKTNTIYMLTLFTTLSTTGYVAFLFIVISYLYLHSKNRFLKWAGLLILPIIVANVLSMDFMWEKIEEQYDDETPWSRFGAILYHIEKIQLSPLLGYGFNELPVTNMDLMLSNIEKVVSPNGITLVPLVFGVPLSIVYYYLVYSSTIIMSERIVSRLIVFVSLLITVFSQDLTTRSFFFMLIFMGVLSLRNENCICQQK